MLLSVLQYTESSNDREFLTQNISIVFEKLCFRGKDQTWFLTVKWQTSFKGLMFLLLED
jgi:hypothetical protein